MNRKTLLLSLAWTASLAAAWWGGMHLANSASQTSVGDKSQARLSTSADALAGRENGGSNAERTDAGEAPQYPSHWELSYYKNGKIKVADRVAKLMEVDDTYERMIAYAELVQSLKTDEEMAEAYGQLQKSSDWRGRGREMSVLLSKWAASNPEAALAATYKDNDRNSLYASSTVLSTWAKANPDGAKAWAEANYKADPKNPEEGNWLMLGVVSGLSKTNIDLAAQWAQQQPRSQVRGEMMDRIVDSMAKQRGMDAATAWVEGLPEGAFRDGVTRKVAWRLTEANPQQSAAWIEGIPSKDARHGAMRDLVDRWANTDPNAAASWLQKFPQTPEMDEPRKTFAWEIREKDPESAVAWAGTLQNQKDRDRLQIEIMKEWSRRDAAAAATYMTQNNWPPEAQSRIFKKLKKESDDGGS